VSVNGPFADNIDRLLGLHRLTGREASRLLDVSTVALSEWRQGKRMPGLPALVKLAELFEIAGDRLVTATFPELLEREAGDVDRFVRVERKLAPTMLPAGTKSEEGYEVVERVPWLVSPDEVAKNQPKGRRSRSRQGEGTRSKR
jgi:transcriptional regulator with XRE-family HTH domain